MWERRKKRSEATHATLKRREALRLRNVAMQQHTRARKYSAEAVRASERSLKREPLLRRGANRLVVIPLPAGIPLSLTQLSFAPFSFFKFQKSHIAERLSQRDSPARILRQFFFSLSQYNKLLL